MVLVIIVVVVVVVVIILLIVVAVIVCRLATRSERRDISKNYDNYLHKMTVTANVMAIILHLIAQYRIDLKCACRCSSCRLAVPCLPL